MARRRRNSKGVLEWVTQTSVEATAATNNLAVIDLDLNPDEVATIWKIRASLKATHEATDDADDLGRIGMVLSTDPSTAVSPIGITAATVDDLEDEEVFWFAREYLRNEFATAVGFQEKNEQFSYETNFGHGNMPPLVVGRNIGMTIAYDETTAILSEVIGICTIYFSRRKGAPEEILNLIKH